MEDHLTNRARLDTEWAALCAYDADPCSVAIAQLVRYFIIFIHLPELNGILICLSIHFQTTSTAEFYTRNLSFFHAFLWQSATLQFSAKITFGKLNLILPLA